MWEAAGLCSGDWLRGLSAADLRAVGVPVFPLPQDSSSSPCDAGEWLKKLNSATANPGLVGADPPLLTDQVCGGKRIHHRLVAAPRAQPGAPAATANVRPSLWHVCVSDIGVYHFRRFQAAGGVLSPPNVLSFLPVPPFRHPNRKPGSLLQIRFQLLAISTGRRFSPLAVGSQAFLWEGAGSV